MHVLLAQKGNQRIELDRVQRDLDMTVMIYPLIHLQPPRARHQWGRWCGAQIIQRRPILATNLQYVAEPACGDERSGRAFAFQKCVGGYGGAVDDA